MTTSLGRSIEELTEQDPGPFEPADDDLTSETSIDDLAATSPLLHRLRALAHRCRRGPVPVAEAVRIAGSAAPMRAHRLGVLSDREVLAAILGGALDAGILELDERTRSVRLGTEGPSSRIIPRPSGGRRPSASSSATRWETTASATGRNPVRPSPSSRCCSSTS